MVAELLYHPADACAYVMQLTAVRGLWEPDPLSSSCQIIGCEVYQKQWAADSQHRALTLLLMTKHWPLLPSDAHDVQPSIPALASWDRRPSWAACSCLLGCCTAHP